MFLKYINYFYYIVRKQLTSILLYVLQFSILIKLYNIVRCGCGYMYGYVAKLNYR